MLNKIRLYSLLILASIVLVSCGGDEQNDYEQEQNEIYLTDIRTIRSDNGNISFDTYDGGIFHFELEGLKIQAVYAESANIQGLYNNDYIPGIPKDSGHGDFTYSIPSKRNMKKYKSANGDFLYFFGENNRAIYCVKEVKKVSKNKYGFNIVVVNSSSPLNTESLSNADVIINAIPSYRADLLKIGKFTVYCSQNHVIDKNGIYYGNIFVIRKKGTLKKNKGFVIEEDDQFMLKYKDGINIKDYVSW